MATEPPQGQPGEPAAAGAPRMTLLVGAGAASAWLVMRIHASGAASELAWPATNAFIDGTAWLAVACLALWSASSPNTVNTPPISWRSPITWGALLFTLAIAVATLRAPHTDIAIRTAISWLSNGALACSLLIAGIRRRDLARDLLCLLAATVVSVSALALFEYFVEWQQMRDYVAGNPNAAMGNIPESARLDFERRLAEHAAMGPFLLPNLLGAFLATIAPIAIALSLAHAQLAPSKRLTSMGFAGVILALTATALSLTGAKGAGLAAAAALAVALLIVASKRWQRLLAPIGVTLLIAAMSIAGMGLVSWRRDPEAFGVGRSLQVRIEYAQASLSMIHDKPLLGVGLGNWRHFYSQHRLGQAEETRYGHMDLLQVTAETGPLGTLGLCLLLIGTLVGLTKALRNSTEPIAHGQKDTPDPGLRKACLLGICLGAVLLAGLRTRYADLNAVIMILLTLIPSWLLLSDTARKAGVGFQAAPNRTLAAAGLAGSAAFMVSSLLDFPFYALGLQASWIVCLVLISSLTSTTPATAESCRNRSALPCAAISAVVATLMTALYLPALREADTWRQLAETGHREAASANVQTPEERQGVIEQLDQAIVFYQLSQAAWPAGARAFLGEAAAHNMLARMSDDPQRLRSTVRALRQARRRAPRSADIADRLATTLLQLAGQEAGSNDAMTTQARAALEDAIRLYPHNPGYQLRLAQVLARMGDTAAAAQHAAAALTSEGLTRNDRLRLSDAQRQDAQRLSNQPQDH